MDSLAQSAESPEVEYSGLAMGPAVAIALITLSVNFRSPSLALNMPTGPSTMSGTSDSIS